MDLKVGQRAQDGNGNIVTVRGIVDKLLAMEMGLISPIIVESKYLDYYYDDDKFYIGEMLYSINDDVEVGSIEVFPVDTKNNTKFWYIEPIPSPINIPMVKLTIDTLNKVFDDPIELIHNDEKYGVWQFSIDTVDLRYISEFNSEGLDPGLSIYKDNKLIKTTDYAAEIIGHVIMEKHNI